jgi:hypothetical protein
MMKEWTARGLAAKPPDPDGPAAPIRAWRFLRRGFPAPERGGPRNDPPEPWPPAAVMRDYRRFFFRRASARSRLRR